MHVNKYTVHRIRESSGAIFQVDKHSPDLQPTVLKIAYLTLLAEVCFDRVLLQRTTYYYTIY